ncbi:MAG: HAD-IA family hydrolase [Burkholderiales bacterium]|jgi:putative hydrolase of the HAD superfamily|nr:HAD-IA family hydrolase [Burkholderiales bacterium]
MPNPAFRAVLWDFGGVITESPFDAFADLERERGLPVGFIRRINATDPDTNAWARFERSEITLAEFDAAFGDESEAAGHRIGGAEVARLLYGAVRPAMVEALRRCKAHYVVACLTNNVDAGPGHRLPTTPERHAEVECAMQLFDHVLESRRLGVRKPERRFYELALEALGVRPEEAVYLDDLGINLKPARAMGMTTIRVSDAAQALRELEAVLDLALTGPHGG